MSYRMRSAEWIRTGRWLRLNDPSFSLSWKLHFYNVHLKRR
jgi:hypothetical protein